MSNLKDLDAKIAELQQQRSAMVKEQKAAAIKELREKIALYELTENDLFGGPKRQGSSGGKVAPKYRDPATGAEWTGRGKPPAWIAGVEDRNKFLIEKAAA